MNRFTPSGPRRRASGAQSVQGAADFLRTDSRMAALLPALTRLNGLQRDCAAILPAMFETCEVLQAGPDQMVLGVPNAALAARLKQQLPKLREALRQRGWQIEAIRIRLRPGLLQQPAPPPRAEKKVPPQAVSALAALSDSLGGETRNEALRAALERMVQRHRG